MLERVIDIGMICEGRWFLNQEHVEVSDLLIVDEGLHACSRLVRSTVISVDWLDLLYSTRKDGAWIFSRASECGPSP